MLRKCWGMYLQYLLFYTPIIKKLDSRARHQIPRKNLTTHANSLVNTLHLLRGTLRPKYFKLFTTFLISGFLHAIAEHLFFQDFSEGATIQFFLLQVVGITFEDTVIGIISRLGLRNPTPSRRLVSCGCYFINCLVCPGTPIVPNFANLCVACLRNT